MNVQINPFGPKDLVRALIGELGKGESKPAMVREITYIEVTVLLGLILGSRGGYYLEEDAKARKVAVVQALYEERFRRLEIAVERLASKGFVRILESEEIKRVRVTLPSQPPITRASLQALLAPEAEAPAPEAPAPASKPKRKKPTTRKPITGSKAEGSDPLSGKA